EAEERMDFCWGRCKAGAKLGAALGCVLGLATLALDRDSSLLGTVVAALGVSIVGGAHGLLIAALAHSIGTSFRAWIEVGLIGVLAGWIALFTLGEIPPLYCVLYGGITGLPVVLALGTILAGILSMWQWIRQR